MSITINWWLVPTLISLVGWFVANRMNRDAGGGFFDAAFSAINYLIFFVVPSLVAWLVWALLR